MGLLSLFFQLVMGHAVADFALQSSAMAQFKNPDAENTTGVPWYYWLTAHALIHGAVVALITKSMALALAEVMIHFWLDLAKCKKYTNIHMDQYAHIICKGFWALWTIYPVWKIVAV